MEPKKYKLTSLEYFECPVILLAPNYFIVDINQSALDIYHWEKHKVINKDFSNLLKNDGLENPFSLIKEKSIRNTLTTIRKNNKQVIIRWKINEIFDEDGFCQEIILTGQDLTLQTELQNKVDELDNVIAQMPGNVYWYDKDLNYLGCNENSAKTLGMSRQETVGKNFSTLLENVKDLSKSSLDQCVKDGLEVLQTGAGKLNILEGPYQGSKGKTIYTLANKVPLTNKKGEVYGLVGISIDITHLKKIIERKIYELDSIIGQMPGNVYWYDKNYKYLGCNQNSAKTLGMSREEAVGKNFITLMKKVKGLSEATINKWVEDGSDVMRTGNAKLNILEEPFMGPDGKMMHPLANKVPLFDENGKIYGVIGISTDISKQLEIEKELKEAKEKAEAASQAKSDFIANMSHDLRTPITGILGIAQDLLNTVRESDPPLESGTPSELKEYIRRLMHHVESDSTAVVNAISPLLNLFNEILESMRLGKGISSQTPESFDSYELIEHNVALLQPTARNKKVDLIVNIDKKVPRYIQGLRTYIDRTLINLISNALKFTDKGSVKISMRLSKNTAVSYKKGDKIKIQISIEDTGIGIPEDKHDTIFEHFSRLNASHEGLYKGSGLGLYTVKVYIQAMKGKIKVKSEVGKGTCFIITLPFIVSDKVDRPRDTSFSIPVESLISEKKAHTPFSISFPPGKNNLPSAGKILIVEDNPTAARALFVSLRPFNCSVDIAENGTQAIEKAQNNSYDMILMDVGLPDMSGIEVTKKIRAFSDAKKSQVPIVAITGHADIPEMRQECLDAGMQDVLSKPARPLLLQEAFQNFVFGNADKKIIQQETQKIPEPTKSLTLEDIAKLLVIDWEISKRMCGDDGQHLLDLLIMLMGDLTDGCAIIGKALKERDVPVIRPELHKMLGGIVYICAPRLEAATKAFQKAVKAETPDWDECERLYGYLLETIEGFRKECEKHKV